MKKKARMQLSRSALFALGVPAVLVPGILFAVHLGWNPQKLLSSKQYYANTAIFPKSGIVKDVRDGDTFVLQSGAEVRLLGINAPDRGESGYASASSVLSSLVLEKTVYLEYDRYQDDKFGRILAWVWVGCESSPTFLAADYMHLSGNASRVGLTENPEGCKQGELVNEKLVDGGSVTPVIYKDRGVLKYQDRIQNKSDTMR